MYLIMHQFYIGFQIVAPTVYDVCRISQRHVIISRLCRATVNARVRVIVISIVVISMVHLTVTASGEWNTFCAYNRSRIIDIECRTCEIKHWSRPLCCVEYRSALYGVWKSVCIARPPTWINIKIESVRIKSL